MSQIMTEPSHNNFIFNNKTLSQFFLNSGSVYEEEKALLGTAIEQIMAQNGYLSNKHIIIWLIYQLDICNDVVRSDLIRRSLEIVVGFTHDDM